MTMRLSLLISEHYNFSPAYTVLYDMDFTSDSLKEDNHYKPQ